MWQGITKDWSIHIDFEYPRGIKNRSIESAYEFNKTPGNIVLT
jgi:hypothetical protein